MTEELDLEAIEARCVAATEGPWSCDESTAYELQCQRCSETICEDCLEQINVESQDKYNVLHMQLYGMHSLIKPNAEFISHARADTSALVAALKESRAEVERLRKSNAGHRERAKIEAASNPLLMLGRLADCLSEPLSCGHPLEAWDEIKEVCEWCEQISYPKQPKSQADIDAVAGKLATSMQGEIDQLREENEKLREAFRAASTSLRTIADKAGKDLLEDILQIRGYANSRATVAQEALDNNINNESEE